MGAQGGRGQRRRMRRLTGTALFVAAFFLSAALAGKGCFLLADKCISAFARGSSGEEGAVEAADAGDSGGIVMVSDEAGLTGLVAIDAGHGGEDDGCYRDGVSEARVNLELAKGLSGKLQELGFDTVMLRGRREPALPGGAGESGGGGGSGHLRQHPPECL